MARKTTKKTRASMQSCHGCNRHKRFVDSDVTVFFCNHCFTMNGNYNRYLKGLPMIKPLENIKVKDLVVGADGDEYKVIGRGEQVGDDKFFPVQNTRTKEVFFLGDFFFTRKV